MSGSAFFSNNSYNVSQHFHQHSHSNDLEDHQAVAASPEQFWGLQQTINYAEPSRSSADVAGVQGGLIPLYHWQNTFQVPTLPVLSQGTSTTAPRSEALHPSENFPRYIDQRIGSYISLESFLAMPPGPGLSAVTQYLLHDERMAAHGAQGPQFPDTQGRSESSRLTFTVRQGGENFTGPPGPSPPHVDAFSSIPMNNIEVIVEKLPMNRGTESLQVQSPTIQEGTFQNSVSPYHTHIKALIERQCWFKENEPEPKLDKEAATRYGIQADECAGSVFDVFINGIEPKSFQCKWPYGRCMKEFATRNRARHHLHAHFHFQPFACGGKCGKAQWQVISFIQRFQILI